MQSGLLNSLLIIPMVAAMLILFLPEVYRVSFKWISLITQILIMINVITIASNYVSSDPGYQFIEHYEWIRLSLGKKALLSIDYIIGVDGISLPMVMLSSLIFLVGNISSFSINKKEKAYYSLYLLLTSSVIGSFIAIDFFLFFLFFLFTSALFSSLLLLSSSPSFFSLSLLSSFSIFSSFNCFASLLNPSSPSPNVPTLIKSRGLLLLINYFYI